MDIAEIDDTEIVCFKRKIIRLKGDFFGLEEAGFDEWVAEQKKNQNEKDNQPAATVPVPDLMAAAAERRGRCGRLPRRR